MEPPKVFISYSHDSDEHKQWVLKLCTKLRENGVDVMLDQWDIRLGTDQTVFMEKLSTADRVLVICTDIYVKKADNREGGVGYEGLIITAQIAENLQTDKFIPIIRQSSNEKKMPIFFGKKQYIGFTDDDRFDEKFSELLHDIHGVPIIPKPPLGENPLPKQPFQPEASNHNLPDIPEKIESVTHAYESAFELARADDTLGWSRLVERIRPNVFTSLVEWRQSELDGQKPGGHEQLVAAVDKAVDIVSPLISVALVGVKSCSEMFNNQKSVLDDLLSVGSRTGWNRSGYREWIDIPGVLGYVYHSLHGSLSLNTDQLTLSISLARVKIRSIFNSEFIASVWKHSELVGWSESFGGKCTDNWKYLVTAYERWEWLAFIFEDEVTYRTSLVAYYMALHIHELAVEINLGREFSSRGYDFSVPIDFLTEENEIKQRAISLLLRNSALSELWTCLNVTQDQMKDSWNNWISCCRDWLRQVYRIHPNQMPHQNFFDAL